MPFETVPCTLFDLKQRFPKATNYFLEKEPAAIEISKGIVTLKFANNRTLAYEFYDVKTFEKTINQYDFKNHENLF